MRIPMPTSMGRTYKGRNTRKVHISKKVIGMARWTCWQNNNNKNHLGKELYYQYKESL